MIEATISHSRDHRLACKLLQLLQFSCPIVLVLSTMMEAGTGGATYVRFVARKVAVERDAYKSIVGYPAIPWSLHSAACASQLTSATFSWPFID
jgi:hypothetical protein